MLFPANPRARHFASTKESTEIYKRMQVYRVSDRTAIRKRKLGKVAVAHKRLC